MELPRIRHDWGTFTFSLLWIYLNVFCPLNTIFSYLLFSFSWCQNDVLNRTKDLKTYTKSLSNSIYLCLLAVLILCSEPALWSIYYITLPDYPTSDIWFGMKQVQMFKLVLEKAEEPETQLPTSAGSWKKQESSRKTSISALLTMPKPLTVWITINCGKFWKRCEYQTIWTASWEICMRVRKQQLELDMEQQTGSK